MIPGLLAREVSEALREFIVTGYETQTPPFAGEFRRLVEEQQNGEAFLKGPYISVGLPFRKGSDTRRWFDGFATTHPPFAHQDEAWMRLASNRNPQNTLVATGTGSGKTECFLYPLLDHCHRNRDKGIKAIVIYPMNALATDQAKRFASIIDSQPAFKGLRVGLFVGGNERSPQKQMTPQGVIACKDTLRSDPPDILLTNYKMLDYLLMRPRDQPLWVHNGPETLKYLVVDELHTFDGAQGTDLALLIRRLRARFTMAPNQMINVGTSATLGDASQVQGLLKYASDIFSSPFSKSSVVGEQRQSEAEFIGVLDYLNLNAEVTPEQLKAALVEGLEPYFQVAHQLIFSEPAEGSLDTDEARVNLGYRLKCHGQLSNLLRELGPATKTLNELTAAMLSRVPRPFAQAPEHIVLALLSLLAHARDDAGQALVQIRVQLWSRELRRIVGRLVEANSAEGEPAQEPLLSYADDKPKEDRSQLRLPLVQCRECHGTAWLSRKEGHATGDKLVSSLPEIYTAFFSRHPETAILTPWVKPREGSDAYADAFRVCRYCGTTSALRANDDCPGCQAAPQDQVRVLRPLMIRERRSGGVNRMEHNHHCPFCQAQNALVVFGSRAPSLSAVAIHRMFSSRDNDDKKLLTFSDSVQDAAHRAGFFSARTWQNNIRMALAQLITAAPAPIALPQLPALFERFWLNHGENKGRLSVEDYLREFMPPDKRYQANFEQYELTGKAPKPEAMLRQIRQRMLWEALEDLSWRMQVGRSLNRVGVAALDWPLAPVQQAAAKWRSTVYNELGFELSDQQAFWLLNGLVLHLVQLGAFGFEFLDAYRVEGGKAYLLTRLDFTPGVGPSSPRPYYPATKAAEGFESLTLRGGSWYTKWLSCIKPDGLVDPKQRDAVMASAFAALVVAGIARQGVSTKGVTFWCLEPSVFHIAQQPVALCSPHQRPLHLAQQQAEAWLKAPLISAIDPEACYERLEPVRASFYQTLYGKGKVHRVIAHEHTGLLAREERQKIEDSFIKGKNPWEYNLLSATPTLEMGIDIGDLSSVLLCSVPPAQANYLQRVGRGGRRDGNSFVLTVANGRPHDLVFYANPKRMLAQTVEPPAIFLKARHVLRRQLLAYAMDCWTQKMQGKNDVPHRMQPVLDAVETGKATVFPYTLLTFISEYMQELWDGFCDHVATDLSDDDMESLRQFLFGGAQHKNDHLQVYVNARLKQVTEERESISAVIKNLQAQVKTLNKQPDDEHKKTQLAELEQELTGYQRLRRRLNERETLNFFTDEGLLPNYAFPEEGATLHSIIFRTEKEQSSSSGATRELVKREYEYQRPAQAALTELAPDSVFYAGNRRVQISRVETAKGRNIQQWRFCPSCSYSSPLDDLNGGFHSPECPRCGSVMWGDDSARTHMLKMSQVYAFTNAKDAQLDDRSDDREPVFFNKQMLIDFDPVEVDITWALEDEDRPFGFEFVRAAKFLEVNFGRRDAESKEFEVAGQNLNRSGFPICKACGSVQVKKNEAQHLRSCRYHAGPIVKQGISDDGIVTCLYLYRQFTSEALRILLPRLSTGGTDAQVQSFVAALQLGLKKRFGGKVDHLRVAHQSEPIGQTDDRRHFVVLYDSVPGGTGYLHDLLADVAHMKEVFQLSYSVMERCDCYDGAMDGCYNCLLEYRNSYGMEHTSKALALAMLKEVVDPQQKWVQSDRRLSQLKAVPWIDSELEARFPQALETFSGHAAVAGKRVRVHKDVVHQKNGFRLSVGELEYACEPHVKLGKSEGVQFESEADLVLWPPSKHLPKVAIYLDGYEHHRDIVQIDLLKRQALMHAGFVVWSLNWYDINHVLGDKAQDVPLLSGCISEDHPKQAVLAVAKQRGINSVGAWANGTGFERLMAFLSEPSIERERSQAWIFALMACPQAQLVNANINSQVQAEARALPVGFTDRLPSTTPFAASVRWAAEDVAAQVSFSMLAGEDALRAGNETQAAVTACYHVNPAMKQAARVQWQRFWTAVTALQFLPNFYAYTPESKASGVAAGLEWPVSDASEAPIVASSGLPGWFAELEPEMAEELKALDAPWPQDAEVGFELCDEDNAVIGESEIAFPKHKLVWLLEEQMDYQPAFEQAGWQIVTSAAALQTALVTE